MTSTAGNSGCDWPYGANHFDSQSRMDIGNDRGIRRAKAFKRSANAGQVAFDFDLVETHAEPRGTGSRWVEDFAEDQAPELGSKMRAVEKVAHRARAIVRERLAGKIIEKTKVP